MGQFAALITISFSAPTPPLLSPVNLLITLLCLCTVGRIPGFNIPRGRGGGLSTNDNESLNKVMETGYRYVEYKCTLAMPFCVLSRECLVRIVAG